MPSLAELTLTERDFQRQITDLAELRGWEWFHVRSARTLDSWRTPGSGTMAQGWPDLVLVKGKRIIFMEVKGSGGRLSAHQERIMGVLGDVAEFYAVWPTDWAFIERELAT